MCVIVPTASGAASERLLLPSVDPLPPAARATVSGIRNLRTLTLDPAALQRLRATGQATLVDLPLGPDTIAAATVTQFEPFAADARADLVEDGGTRRLALPDRRYYRGRVAGDPQSLVVVTAAPDAVRGVVASGGTVYRFGPDREGVYRSWALRDADPAAFGAPPSLDDDVVPVAPQAHVASPLPQQDLATPRSTLRASSAFSPTLLAEVAIDTDQEFLQKFQSSAGALAYLADLAAVVSSVYDADVGVRVVFRSIRLWATADPWTESQASLMVYEVSRYWNLYESATPRDLIHFISGKDNLGGAAFLGAPCTAFAVGASVVHGAFDLLSPSDMWDVFTVAHELGHEFGSVHTHCYDPPLDHCWSGESGCYSGPTEVPPEGGTIMSYCPIATRNLTFHPTVGAVLRANGEAAACLGSPCGDGRLDPGEECDDGNVADGDCCSSVCTLGPDGIPCDDGNACTTTETCAGGACVGIPVADGAPCDDGRLCTSDACVAGTCVGVHGPAATCRRTTQPLASTLKLKDAGGGGTGNRLSWRFGKGEATALADFGDPTTTDGYELCIYDAASSVVIAGRLPAGRTCAGVPCWTARGDRGFDYKDKAASPEGMRALTLRSGLPGKARIKATGKDIAMPPYPGLAGLLLPLRVQLHGAGSCWEASFSSPSISTRNAFKAKSD